MAEGTRPAGEAIEFDTSRWPVMIVRPLRAVANPEIDQFLHEYRKFLDLHPTPFATVLDLRQYREMPPAQRKRISDGMKDNPHHPRCRGFALVFSSPLLRMLLTAILWTAKPDYELKVFSDLDEALTWARSQVRDDSPLPAAGP